MGKLITIELINERLEAKGFGDKQREDKNLAKKSVLDYYGVKLTSDYTFNAEFSIYEESTVDGYAVWIATCDTKQINVCEDVHYYDSDLDEALAEAMKYSNGDSEDPEIFYIEDEHANYVYEAIDQLFVYLSEKFEEEVINELTDEGYEEQD
jgi:hypothetical protein